MDASAVQLSSLLLALFKGGELLRFARHVYGEFLTLEVDREASLTHQAEALVEQLRKADLVNDRLFDALLENRPERAKDIEQVRRQALGELETDEPTVRAYSLDADPVSEERRAWRRRMAALLEGVTIASPEPAPEWIEAAAVLERFDPQTLSPVGTARKAPRDLLERLAAVCDTLPDGSFSLELRRRQRTLGRLFDEGRLADALKANPKVKSKHRNLLRRALDQQWIEARELAKRGELEVAFEIAEWLTLSRFRPFDRDQVTVLLERRRRVAPLRRLLGRHFRGRASERRRIHGHLRGKGAPILTLWGIGGVGKSALLGKVLLDLEKKHGTARPWVYLDFDDPAVDPLHPNGLIELMARQLGEFFAGATIAQGFHAVESTAGGDDLAFTLRIDGGTTGAGLLAKMDSALSRQGTSPSLCVVFDTFEQAQVRGRRAVELVRALMDDIVRAMPYARVIVSGRARVPSWDDDRELQLADLDAESADGVLTALGVTDADVRAKVLERVGRNPLSLRLAADAITSESLGEEDIETLVVKARHLELQGQLYTRILGHIADGEVRRLAHPGLIVRRVTPGVLRDVLAELCRIQEERIAAVFERLPDHVSLFEPDQATPEEGSALRHRQDVREVMLRLMIEDPAWAERLKEIHIRAIDHYRGREDAIGRAEELYHRLMRDDEPETLDALWSDELAPSLGRCWDEPLPERARAWLGPRIGRTEGDQDAWRAEDWEIAAEREVKARLKTGDAAGALEVLAERREFTPGSRLHRLKIQALVRLERWQEAADGVGPAVDSAAATGRLKEVLELHLLGAEIGLAGERWAYVEEHLRRALKIANDLNDGPRRLRALLLEVQAATARGQETARSISALALEKALIASDEEQLRHHELLTRRVLAALTPHSAPVLRKMASTFGNRSDQQVIRPDAFKLEGLLKKVGATGAGKRQLSELAGSVGLAKEGYRIRDLAGQAVRYGKLGDALVAVLDHAGFDEKVRAGAASMFHEL